MDLHPESEAGYQLETNTTNPDISDLTALIAAVNGPDGSFMPDAEERLDLDEVLTLGAVQAIIADWDGYFGTANNYKLYHDLGSDRFLMFHWGIDQTFGASDLHLAGSSARARPSAIWLRAELATHRKRTPFMRWPPSCRSTYAPTRARR